MHELSRCTVASDGGSSIDGFVRAFDGDTLTIATDDVARAPAVGQDVTVDILDEVRGECLYAGFVARVTGESFDVADAELVSTLQKREVVRVGVSIPCRGVVVPVHGSGEAGPLLGEPDGLETDPTVQAEPGHGDDADTDPDVGPQRQDPEKPPLNEGPLEFTLLDISAHGMRILARETLRGGSTIRFWFLELDEPFPIDAIVLRSQQSRTGTHYGCRFAGLTSKQSDALFRYVLQTQGAQRRERLRS